MNELETGILAALATRHATTRRELLELLEKADIAVHSTGRRGIITGQLQTISSKLCAMRAKGLVSSHTEDLPTGRQVYWSLPAPATPTPDPAAAVLDLHTTLQADPTPEPPDVPAPATLAEAVAHSQGWSTEPPPRPSAMAAMAFNETIDRLDYLSVCRADTRTLTVHVSGSSFDLALMILDRLGAILAPDISAPLVHLRAALETATETTP